ncbi:hypothetical protein J7E71_18775 [Mesobacillus foraminis]|uniref:hypothetical protein n=1 Tax=Mesobacillus foraminis TaxID=279826 RepID=UPI001BECD84A|nr:hypothetical protein [Mesobacillus foraminis]MBT2757921.1 hypothetical protein [Mesobacillus foraminis]
MDIGPRHLIKWGIAGWTFLFVLITYFLIHDYEAIEQLIFNNNTQVLLSFIFLFLSSGIILGNIIYHISIALGFVVWSNSKKHFKDDWDLNHNLMNHPKGKEIQNLYRSRLGNVLVVNALLFSLLLSFITLVIFCFTIAISKSILLLMAIVLGLILIVLANLLFLQNTLRYFVKRINSGF